MTAISVRRSVTGVPEECFSGIREKAGVVCHETLDDGRRQQGRHAPMYSDDRDPSHLKESSAMMIQGGKYPTRGGDVKGNVWDVRGWHVFPSVADPGGRCSQSLSPHTHPRTHDSPASFLRPTKTTHTLADWHSHSRDRSGSWSSAGKASWQMAFGISRSMAQV
jgi:hypothetical protein